MQLLASQEDSMTELKKSPSLTRRATRCAPAALIGNNTTNLNDFNNMKYAWVSDWYRQAMNNFWIPQGDQPLTGCEGLSPPAVSRAQRPYR